MNHDHGSIAERTESEDDGVVFGLFVCFIFIIKQINPADRYVSNTPIIIIA